MVASITFEAGQPLELNGGEQVVVLEQRGARVVNAGVSRENESCDICSMRCFLESRDGVQEINSAAP